ncbi:hypothetical protein MRB53_035895 [Persea americana]|uniref:Uncharacterized protein n=1 Tax=Persea americana TaxID=3435 RepID=A0ACC2K5W5_PERAE|nr:hypothetical protein MRB53_035895 [Persea americana]
MFIGLKWVISVKEDTEKHFSYPTNEVASETNASPEDYNDDIDFNDDLDDVLNQDESDTDRNSAGSLFFLCRALILIIMEGRDSPGDSSTIDYCVKTERGGTKREISLLAGEGKKTAQGRCQSKMRKTNQTASAILINAKSVDQRRTHFGSDCSSLEKKQGFGVQALLQVKNKLGERER